MWPSSHSSGSRTSTKSGLSGDACRALRLDRGDLVDLLLHAREQLSVPGHYFPNYSGVVPGAASGSRGLSSRRERSPPRSSSFVALAAAAAVAVVAAAVVSSRRRLGDDRREPRAASRAARRSRSRSASGRRRGARSRARRDALRARGTAAARPSCSRGTTRSRRRSAPRSPPGRTGRSTAWSSSRSSIPEPAVVQLHLGLARLWAQRGDPSRPGARRSRPSRTRRTRSSPATCCTRSCPRGLPAFIPSFAAPAGGRRSLAPGAPARGAPPSAPTRGGVRELLLYGVGLQRVGRPVSARAVFDAAARGAPGERRGAGRRRGRAFDKDAPARAFGRLGPLTRTFPQEPTVRFHLGVLLLWTGRVERRRAAVPPRVAHEAGLAARAGGRALPGHDPQGEVVEFAA